MPRKTPRPPGPDEWAAERIRYERERRGWSTAELARRVSLAGVQMRQQQVWQVESGQPPRRLSVGEATAFASVFGITLDQLMKPPAQSIPDELVQLAAEFRAWRLAEGAQAALLASINDRIGEISQDAQYTADNVATYTAPTADRAISDLETIIANLQHVLAAIREGGSAWKVVASVIDIVPAAGSSQPESGEART